MDYDLGYIDLEEKTLQPLDSPFGAKVCYRCVRVGPSTAWRWTQSPANYSLALNSLLTGKNTGNFLL
jgi:hypothetical protein